MCVRSFIQFHNKAAPAFQNGFGASVLTSTLPSLIDSVLILILVPLWNNIVFPLLGHYVPNTRKRLGVGILLGAVAMLLAGVMYAFTIGTDFLSRLFFIPLVIMIVAESLVFVPGIDFF